MTFNDYKAYRQTMMKSKKIHRGWALKSEDGDLYDIYGTKKYALEAKRDSPNWYSGCKIIKVSIIEE